MIFDLIKYNAYDDNDVTHFGCRSLLFDTKSISGN